MATSLSPEEAKRLDRRKRVMLGPLPPDFLTLGQGQPILGQERQMQEQLDEQAALALHQQLNRGGGVGIPSPVNVRGRLLISVMQAKLVKNYGMTRMDPYVRIHIGHHIYETPTDVNGAKNPKWNKTIQCFLPVGINSIYLEIYDECNFSVDELIAHSNITIPEPIFKGETSEEWYPLSGKQGEGKEGQVLLVFSFMAAAAGMQQFVNAVPYTQGHGHGHRGAKNTKNPPPPVHISGQPVTQAVPNEVRPDFSEDDFKQLKEMFPNMDVEVVRSVYEGAGFNKDAAADALLGMCE